MRKPTPNIASPTTIDNMGHHRYFPHTDADIARMLGRCGVDSLDALYADVDSALRLKKPYDIPGPMSEPALDRYFDSFAAQNKKLTCFAGAGFYHHYTPALIPALMSRSEFLTAYTPYQPEISQGTLQYIFEYQSMMADLTGLDVSNASMYDGATASAEAMVMAVNSVRKKRRVLVSATVAPAVQQVMRTYAEAAGITLEVIPEDNGVTDSTAFTEMLGAGDVAAVMVAQPNYYGIVENIDDWADKCHQHKALLIMNCHASTLGILKSPGEWGADIACGEAQSLGMPLNYGGPYLGYLCCREAFMRKLPGRVVGATTDREGRRSFVLTLQAREQHIRRQKATSNICSNQGIMTLHAAIYMALMGAEGLEKVNRLSAAAAHSLAEKLESTGKMKLKYPGTTWLNEFAMEITAEGITADRIIEECASHSILAGVKLTDDSILIAATEMCTPEDIDRYVSIINEMKP